MASEGAGRPACSGRDGAWYWDRFYRPSPAAHYESTVRALTESGRRADALPPPPARFTQLEQQKSAELQHPFSEHDNRHRLDRDGESLTGRQRKRRPCCVRPLHSASDPCAFVNTADPPAAGERHRTSTMASYRGQAPEGRDAPAGPRRHLYARQAPCPFAAGECDHHPGDIRRMEPASTAPAAAAAEH